MNNEKIFCGDNGCFAFLFSATASNSGTINELNQPFPIDVKAEEVKGPNIYKNKIDGDSASITTKSGITVSVTAVEGKFEPDARLVVRVIPSEEADAYGWFSEVLKETGTNVLPFDIYFEKGGQNIPINIKIRITITLPDGYNTPIICYVTTDGKVEVLQSSANNGKISFETNHTSYYVLANKINNATDDSLGWVIIRKYCFISC